MKAYQALGEAGKLAGLAAWDRKVAGFKGSRALPDVEVEYLVEWEGVMDRTWIPHDIVVALGAAPVLDEYLLASPH